jgi:hypothetical protein
VINTSDITDLNIIIKKKIIRITNNKKIHKIALLLPVRSWAPSGAGNGVVPMTTRLENGGGRTESSIDDS